MRIKIALVGMIAMVGTQAAAISQEEFAKLAMKAGGALVGECPAMIMTKDEILNQEITSGIYKVTTQKKIGGSYQSGYAVNPIISASKKGCIFKLQKVENTRSGRPTLKNN